MILNMCRKLSWALG